MSGDGQRAGRNVLGEPLEICAFKPTTGFYRDGCCNTGHKTSAALVIERNVVCTLRRTPVIDLVIEKSPG
jgi:uncharacterized protein (DUF2237 family)